MSGDGKLGGGGKNEIGRNNAFRACKSENSGIFAECDNFSLKKRKKSAFFENFIYLHKKHRLFSVKMQNI